MSFIISEPLVLILLFLVVGLFLGLSGRKSGRVLIILSVCALWALSTPIVSSYLLDILQARIVTNLSGVSINPQAIVVLGGDIRRAAPEFGGDTVGQLTLERVRFAAKLHRQTALPILVTGKLVAVAMKETLNQDFGVEVEWVESAARTTFENANLSATLLHNEGIRTVYVVTHAWHMPRSVGAFENAGLTAIAAPTAFTPISRGSRFSDYVPFAQALTNGGYAIHELLGLVWYRLAYYQD